MGYPLFYQYELHFPEENDHFYLDGCGPLTSTRTCTPACGGVVDEGTDHIIWINSITEPFAQKIVFEIQYDDADVLVDLTGQHEATFMVGDCTRSLTINSNYDWQFTTSVIYKEFDIELLIPE